MKGYVFVQNEPATHGNYLYGIKCRSLNIADKVTPIESIGVELRDMMTLLDLAIKIVNKRIIISLHVPPNMSLTIPNVGIKKIPKNY